MPIWLLCFLGNAFGHLAYSCAELTSNDAWGLFASADRKTTAKSSALCVAMAVGMPFHIHTYGIAAVLMGDAGAVFAWPVVMSSTVFTAVERFFAGVGRRAARGDSMQRGVVGRPRVERPRRERVLVLLDRKYVFI
jgi:hypothetical protein